MSATVTSKWEKGRGGPSGNEASNGVVIPLQDGRGLEKHQNGIGIGEPNDPSYTLDATGGQSVAVSGILVPTQMSVRRLTPLECERLQGFPDKWTLVPHRGKPAADGPRYKAIGNSMAVNCMRFIGTRIEAFK